MASTTTSEPTTTTSEPTTTAAPTTTTPEPVGHFSGYNRMIPAIITEELVDEMVDSGIIPVL